MCALRTARGPRRGTCRSRTSAAPMAAPPSCQTGTATDRSSAPPRIVRPPTRIIARSAAPSHRFSRATGVPSAWSAIWSDVRPHLGPRRRDRVATVESVAKAPTTDIRVGERTVGITNPDRVYFPASGATKLDLVHYYLHVG